MRKTTIRFEDVAGELEQINAQRDEIMERAFALLEQKHATLASMLVQSLGERVRALRWMCKHQQAFDGRTAYELLGDGEEDTVWDEIAQLSEGPVTVRAAQARMAY